MACNNFGIVIFNMQNFTNENIWVKRRVLSTLSIFIATMSWTLKEGAFPLLVSFLYYNGLDFHLGYSMYGLCFFL